MIVVLLGAASLLAYVPYAALSSIYFGFIAPCEPSSRPRFVEGFPKDFVLFSIACLGFATGNRIWVGTGDCMQVFLYPWRRVPIQMYEVDGVLHVDGVINYVGPIV